MTAQRGWVDPGLALHTCQKRLGSYKGVYAEAGEAWWAGLEVSPPRLILRATTKTHPYFEAAADQIAGRFAYFAELVAAVR